MTDLASFSQSLDTSVILIGIGISGYANFSKAQYRH